MGGAGGQPGKAILLDCGAEVGDESQQRLSDVQQGEDGDDRAGLVADDRARADAKGGEKRGGDAAAGDDGRGAGPGEAGGDVPGGQQRQGDGGGYARRGEAEDQPGGGQGDELGSEQRGAAWGDQDGGGDGLVPEFAGDREHAGEQRDGLGQPGDGQDGAGGAGAGGDAGGRGGGGDPAGDQGGGPGGEQPVGAGGGQPQCLGAEQAGHDGAPWGVPVSSR